VAVRDGEVTMRNDGAALYYVATVEGDVPTGAEDTAPGSERRTRAVHAVLPPGHRLDVQLWPGADEASVRVTAGTADRVDMVVPRRHALVRHAAGGSDETYQRHRDALRHQAPQTGTPSAAPPSAEESKAQAEDA
jgi:hypothetical protein